MLMSIHFSINSTISLTIKCLRDKMQSGGVQRQKITAYYTVVKLYSKSKQTQIKLFPESVSNKNQTACIPFSIGTEKIQIQGKKI